MESLLIASNNPHKVSEIKSILNPDKIKIFSLAELGILEEVAEDGNTLNENAFIKAASINKISKIPTISDDTGLFVEALNGRPGVFSARYAGEKASYRENRVKLLNELKDFDAYYRAAYFESVICFYLNEKEFYFFNGICSGKIIFEEKGEGGFGYDSVFMPSGFKKTFAEMSDEEKNNISHRANALRSFKKFSYSFFQ